MIDKDDLLFGAFISFLVCMLITAALLPISAQYDWYGHVAKAKVAASNQPWPNKDGDNKQKLEFSTDVSSRWVSNETRALITDVIQKDFGKDVDLSNTKVYFTAARALIDNKYSDFVVNMCVDCTASLRQIHNEHDRISIDRKRLYHFVVHNSGHISFSYEQQ